MISFAKKNHSMKDEDNRRVEIVYGGLTLPQILRVAVIIIAIILFVVMVPIVISQAF